jgi:TolA-binding protein
MNTVLTILTRATLLTMALVLMSCGTSQEAEQADAFFDPLPVIERSAPPPPVTPPPVFAPNVNATILVLVREQNEHLRELMRQIAVITDREDIVAPQIAHADSVQRILGSGDAVPDTVLLGLLEDENHGLTGAVQKLRGAAEHHRQVTSELMAYKASEYVPQGGGQKPAVSYEQALQRFQKREFAKAASAFQALLNYGVRKDLADDCYFWLGVSQFQLRNLSDAEFAFNRVLEFRRSNTKEAAYLMLGQCYEQLGSPKLAIATFERGIKEFPHGSLRSVVNRKIAQLN